METLLYLGLPLSSFGLSRCSEWLKSHQNDRSFTLQRWVLKGYSIPFSSPWNIVMREEMLINLHELHEVIWCYLSAWTSRLTICLSLFGTYPCSEYGNFVFSQLLTTLSKLGHFCWGCLCLSIWPCGKKCTYFCVGMGIGEATQTMETNPPCPHIHWSSQRINFGLAKPESVDNPRMNIDFCTVLKPGGVSESPLRKW